MRELWGPRGELLTHHELGNLQRTESVRGKEPQRGRGWRCSQVGREEVKVWRGSGEYGGRRQEDRKGLERTR